MKTRNPLLLLIPLFFLLLLLASFLGDGKQSVVDTYGVALVLVLWVIRILNKNPVVMPPTKLFIPWIATIVVAVISSTQSYSMGFSVSWIIRLLCAFMLYRLLYDIASIAAARVFVRASLLFAAAVGIVASVFALFPSVDNMLPSMNLLTNRFGHNHIADILVFVTPFVWFELVKQVRPERKTLVAVAAYAALLVMSFARGAWLIVGGYALWILIQNGILRSKRWPIVIPCALVILTAASVVLAANVHSGPLLILKKPQTLSSRVEYWRQSLGAIRERPLFGYGPGTFSLVSVRYQDAPYHASWFAHSQPLQILSEVGVVGFLAFAWLCLIHAQTFLTAIRDGRKDIVSELSMLIDATALIFIYGCVEFTLDYMVTWYIFWAMTGLISGIVCKSKQGAPGGVS